MAREQYIYLTNRVRGDSAVFGIPQYLMVLARVEKECAHWTNMRTIGTNPDEPSCLLGMDNGQS